MEAGQYYGQIIRFKYGYSVTITFFPGFFIFNLSCKFFKIHEHIGSVKNPVSFGPKLGGLITFYFHKCFLFLVQELYPWLAALGFTLKLQALNSKLRPNSCFRLTL